MFPDSVVGDADTPIPGAISPDGSTITAFGLAGSAQQSGLYLRRTDQVGMRLLAGTELAYEPAFSPDGSWLAYMRSDGDVQHLVKYRLADGKTEVVTTANSANGMDWLSANEIITGQDGSFHGLARVSATGGELAEFTHPTETGTQEVHLWPVVASDSKTVVFAIYRGTLATSELAITTVPEGKVTRLGVRGIRPLGILDRHLVYVQADGTVMAAPIDIGARRLVGAAIPVHEPVDVTPTANGQFPPSRWAAMARSSCFRDPSARDWPPRREGMPRFPSRTRSASSPAPSHHPMAVTLRSSVRRQRRSSACSMSQRV